MVGGLHGTMGYFLYDIRLIHFYKTHGDKPKRKEMQTFE